MLNAVAFKLLTFKPVTWQDKALHSHFNEAQAVAIKLPKKQKAAWAWPQSPALFQPITQKSKKKTQGPSGSGHTETEEEIYVLGDTPTENGSHLS